MNLVEILKNVPKGTKLYSTLTGDVELVEVDDNLKYPIRVKSCDIDGCSSFSKEGKFNVEYPNGECVLFPSKENRDWSTFKVEKSYEFRPFDPVLVRDCESDKWRCNYFSHIEGENYVCVGSTWNYCIPYNSETAHLAGTNKSFM